MMVPRRALSIAVSVALLASCEAKTRSFSNAQGDAGDEDASPANGASDEGSELPPDDAGGTTSDTSSADTSSSSENDDETVDPNDGDASVDETSTATDDTSGDETTSESGADTSSESSDSDDTDTATSSDSTSSETAAGGSGGFGGQASGGVGGATNGGAEAGGTGNGGAGAGGNGGTTSGGASGSAGNGGGTSGSGGMGGAGVGGTNAGGGGVGGSGGHGGTGAGGSGGIGGAGGSGGTGDPECTLDEECPPPNNPCQETAVCNDGSCEVGPSPCGEMPAGCECVELGSSICGVAAVDEDGDSFGTTECVLLPGDDCDDTAPLVYPRAPELCDGIDNDCDDLPDLLDGTPLHGTNQTLVLSARQPRIDWSSTLETFGVSWAGTGFARFNTMSPLGALSVSPSTTFWQTVAAGGTFTNNAVAANTLGFGLLGVITEGVAGPVQQIPTFFHLASDGPQESTPLQGTQPCSLGLTTSGDRGWLYCGRASQGLAHAFLPLGNDAAPSNGPDLDSAYLAGATLMTGAPVGAIVGWDAIPVALPEPPAGWSMQQHFANFTSPSVKPTVSAAWPVAESYATVVGAVGSSSFATAWRYEGKASTWFGNRASQDVSCGPVTVAEDFIPLKMLPFGSNFLILGLETSAATPALAVVLVAADCEVLSLPLLVGPSGTADALSPDFAAGGQGVAVVWTENNNVRRRVFGLNLCDAPTP